MTKNLLATVTLAFAGIGISHATPIISDSSWDGDHRTLQCLFNGADYDASCAGAGDGWISSGPALDPNAEMIEAAHWEMGATGASISRLVIEIAGNANQNSFGIYSIHDPSITMEIFSGPQTSGAIAVIQYMGSGVFANLLTGASVNIGGQVFGFYLAGPGGTFYSDSSLNPNGDTQMVAFQGGNDRYTNYLGLGSSPWLANEWLLAWEDLVYANSDQDFNDMVVLVESVSPVPTPAALALLGLGLLGLGLVRRRRFGSV